MDTRPRTSLISFCTVQLRTLCAAHSLATLCLFMTSGPDPGELPGFWGSMVFRHAPIPRKGSGKQQQQQQLTVTSRSLRIPSVCSAYCLAGSIQIETISTSERALRLVVVAVGALHRPIARRIQSHTFYSCTFAINGRKQ